MRKLRKEIVVESEGECVECGKRAILGNGRCVKCGDLELGRREGEGRRKNLTPVIRFKGEVSDDYIHGRISKSSTRSSDGAHARF